MQDLADHKKPLHFVPLDTLRFFAAIMVVFHHVFDGWIGWYRIPGKLSDGAGGWSKTGEVVNTVSANATFGVDLFFLISGFLITYLLLREKNDTGKINLPRFYVRRILRIWPLYFFVVAITPFLVSWLRGSLTVPEPRYLPTMLFYNNFDTMSTQSWGFPFAHFWSICIEEHFYLVWPLLVLLVPVRRLPVVLVSVIALSVGFRAWAFYHSGNAWFAIYLHTLARIDVMAMGGLGAWLYFHRPVAFSMPPYLRLFLFAALAFLFMYDGYNAWPDVFEACFKKFIYLALAGLLMANYIFSPTALFRFGPKHVFTYLGRCSYGIYIWGNILVPLVITKFMWRFFPEGNSYVYWLAMVGGTIGIAVISYELIEKPFLKLKSRFAVIRTRV